MAQTRFYLQYNHSVFCQEYWSDPSMDGDRDDVYRQLSGLHDLVLDEIDNRGHNWDIHSHWMQSYHVSPSHVSERVPSISSMQIRFSKSREVIQYAEDHLLGDFGRQANHMRLECRICETGIAVQLYVDQEAWLDGRNLTGKLLHGSLASKHRADLAELMQANSNNSSLRVVRPYRDRDGWWHSREVVDVPTRELADSDEIEYYMGRYRYGEHHLSLGVLYGPEDRPITEGLIVSEIVDRFEELYPVYHFLAWSPDNDFRAF